ncbi:MAG: class I SAM-dependent methyltransferase, partial [Acidobacteriota bacterium]
MRELIAHEIDQYAYEHTTEESELLQRLREETYAHMPIPQMQVGRIAGTFLKLLVRLTKAQRVLEIGMFTGYSTLMLAEGLPENGQLITCDIDPKAAEVARRYFDQSPYGKKIEIRLGPALETLATLSEPFDLVFIDADKGNYTNYYEASIKLLRPGGLIVTDNVLWSGMVLSPSDTDSQAIAAFNNHVQADKRVENVCLTVR